MIRTAISLEINRPVEEVFAFMNEPANLFKWSQQIEEVRQLTSGPIDVGSEFEIVSRFMGSNIHSMLIVTEYLPNERVSSEGHAGGMKLRSTTSYEPHNGNTLIKMESEIEPSGFWKLIAPLLPALIRRQTASDHRRLRASIEQTISKEKRDMGVVDISRTIVSAH